MDQVQIPTWAAVLVAILGAVGGLSGVAALLNARTKASTSKVDALCEIIDAQTVRIEALEKQVAHLRKQVKKWKGKYYDLAEWADKRGLDPYHDHK